MINDLKDFSDPKKYKSPLSIKDHNAVDLKKMLKTMLLIRKTEQQLAIGRKEGLIGGPVHLGVGQEAIAVGVTVNLKKLIEYLGHTVHILIYLQ